GAVESAIMGLSPRQQRELRLFLRLLESRAFMFVVARRVHPISCLSLAQRERALLAMSESLLPQVRSGFQALKRLATFLFYTLLTKDGTNPTWRALDYRLPRPAPGATPLVLTGAENATTIDADVCI